MVLVGQERDVYLLAFPPLLSVGAFGRGGYVVLRSTR